MATESLAYSAAALSISYLGVALTGLAEGDAVVTVSPTNEQASLTVGIQGDTGIALSADNSATITIEFLQGSESCEFLQAKLNAQKIGAVVSGALSIRDANSGTNIIGNRAFINTQPEITRGAAYGTMTWSFVTPDLVVDYKAETI